MKLIIKEYISQLKESGGLDRLLPDLLARMKIIPISRAQIGVRQNGVDIAAIGRDERGVKTLFLFVLKIGDLGRRDWDEGINTVRPTLNQIKDVYLRSFVRPEHKDLPIKIIVCSTGDLKQEVTADFNGYAESNSSEQLSYEFWSGDTLADYIDTYLLDEYAVDPSERADLRRALALIGSGDYDLRHAYRLFRKLLLEEGSVETRANSTSRKRFVRKLKTSALALEIIFRWAKEEGNLLNAFRVGERCCLWGWEFIRARDLTAYRPAISAYMNIFNVHGAIARAYYEKIGPYCYVRDGISVHTGENALVTGMVFEQIGILAEIGILQIQGAFGQEATTAFKNAQHLSDALAATIKNNPSSGSPRFDEHAIELSLALTVLFLTEKHDAAKEWLHALCDRIMYTFKLNRWFPISTDSLDDLIAFDIGQLNDHEVEKLRGLSTLIPTLCHWCVIFGLDDLYREMHRCQKDIFKDICLQLWYLDEETENHMYQMPAQFESGTTEAPIQFPESIDELLSTERRKIESGAIVPMASLSAVDKGMFGLAMMACRHFRTPVPPQLWTPLFAWRELATDLVK